MKKALLFALIVCALSSCSSTPADEWNTYTLDPPNHNLRGHDEHGSEDKPEADCDPEKHYSCDPKNDSHCDPNHSPACDPASDSQCKVSLEYKCVARFLADDQRMKDEIATLRSQLASCQQGH